MRQPGARLLAGDTNKAAPATIARPGARPTKEDFVSNADGSERHIPRTQQGVLRHREINDWLDSIGAPTELEALSWAARERGDVDAGRDADRLAVRQGGGGRMACQTCGASLDTLALVIGVSEDDRPLCVCRWCAAEREAVAA